MDGEGEPLGLTNAEFDARVRAIAATLRARVPAGDRALIVCPAGLDYVASFFACLYAQVIAVPVYPPNPSLLQRTLPRLLAVIDDARPSVVLAPGSITAMSESFAEHAPRLRDLIWLTVDDVDPAAAQEWRRPDIAADDLAFLQYTSGSTSSPKGVMVGHDNLRHNIDRINREIFGTGPGDHMVTWLPPYHDMGLIAGLLAPAHAGYPVTFMSPFSFLKRPLRWLQAIAANRATISGGPNFAYELCLTKITEQERAELDLSTWRIAFSGAEPVRLETLDRFAGTFAESSFDGAALMPAYGLAEGTLAVSAGGWKGRLLWRHAEAEALTRNEVVDARPGAEARTVVGCGVSISGQRIAVVDPATRRELPAERVGEIWVAGPSVAKGYWERPRDTEETFAARLDDTGEGPFLRTGDLGFLDGGNLYVTGRIKDVLIVDGRNHYPQDIERTVELSDPVALRQGCGVAGSVTVDGRERVVVVQELARNPASLDLDAVMAAIRVAVAEEHGLGVDEIVLVGKGKVPKTSSGKLQRSACLALFRAGGLDAAATWSATPAARPAPAVPVVGPDEVEARLRAELSAALGVPAAELDRDRPLAGFGLRSVEMVSLVGGLEQWLGRTLPATLMWEYPTIARLASHLGAPGVSATGPVDDPAGSARPEAPSTIGPVEFTHPDLTHPDLTPTDPADVADRPANPVRDGVDVAHIEAAHTRAARAGATRTGLAPAVAAPAGAAPAGFESAGAAPAEAAHTGTAHIEAAPAEAGRTGLAPADGAPAGAAPADVAARPADPVREQAGGGAGDTPAEPIAVIGIGCRFPGADGPESFWQLLREGRDAVGTVPADRPRAEDFGPEGAVTRHGGFLADVDRFDPHFFGISPQEAARMDPQQRLLAEVAWEALEDAGLPASRLAGSRTGVFVGISSFDYATFQLNDLDGIDAHTGTGSALSIAANRLSYLWDLRGPSMAVDTACSSSLVAVLQACASLARGDSDLALAAGVNLVLSPAGAINFAQAGVMSPGGRCKPFDAAADGYVRAEGAGVVVLKPLRRALADGDPVHAVVRGGAVNQDGRSNGLMAPNPHAQEAVLRAAYAAAGVAPGRVHYAEAHGTGTPLGDPIEVKALAAVLGEGRPADRPCLIGSVKSNVGHMEAAAGIGGLIKAVLMVRHREVPPTVHFREPNPHIPFHELPLRVADALAPWPVADEPALVGVSSFGFGGTNAHLVVEQAPARVGGSTPDGLAHPVAISARTADALRELAGRYERLTTGGGVTVRDLSFSSTARRDHHEHRLVVVGDSAVRLGESLRAFAAGEDAPGLAVGTRRSARSDKAVFVFSGQGSRWWPVAPDLADSEPVFRSVLRRCDALLRRHVDWSLLEQLAAADSRLLDTDRGQPALCAVQIALAALWRSWGVEPAAVVGHSVGEIAAAHVAGALGLEDALLIALHRGTALRAAVGRGRMAVVGLPWDRVPEVLAGRTALWAAAGNSPGTTVLSGGTAEVERLVADLAADGVFARLLESVEFASHSPLVEPVATDLWERLSGLRPRATAVPMISTVTGEPVDGARLDAGYWAENIVRPVLFDRVVTALVESGHDAFVEISPHPVLGDAVRERIEVQRAEAVVVASLRRDRPSREALFTELGALYAAGWPLDWTRVVGTAGSVVGLPTYPWQRQPLWLPAGRARRSGRAGHPLLAHEVRSAVAPRALHWTARVDLDGFGYLDDHRVDGTAVLPAAAVLDAALTAARRALGDGTAVIEDVRLSAVTVVPAAATDDTLQLVLVPEAPDTGVFRLFTRDTAEEGWTEAADGRYRLPDRGATTATEDLAAVRSRCATPVDVAGHYAALHGRGLGYGPAFQGIAELWCADREALARLAQPVDRDPYTVHPALLDSCLQVLGAALDAGGTHLPVGVGRFTVSGAPAWARATAGVVDGADITGCRVELFDAGGRPVGVVEDIALRRLGGGRDAVDESVLVPVWREADAPAAPAAAPGRWLLLADRDGTCADLRSGILAAGGDAVTVTPAAGFRRVDATRYEIDPDRAEDVTALVAEVGVVDGVVHAWALDAGAGDEAGDEAARLWTGPTASALHLVRALAAVTAPPRLVVLTRGAQRVADEPVAVAQAALWGLARVVESEHAELRPLIVDLDPAGGVEGLYEEVTSTGAGQLALRAGRRFAPRLAPFDPRPARAERGWRHRPAGGDHRVMATRPGLLDSLEPVHCDPRPPGPGEVRIAVSAAGLNFNDVLKAMGDCPGVPAETVPLGAECAGTVVAVGEGVTTPAVGDAVVAVAPASMATTATTRAELVAPRPAGLDDAEAAAVPIAFLTAVYGLEHLGRLAPGETVLIHAATGGVGLAALQVARAAGAEVFATAGTEEKRELLRGMGVPHVMDSRSLRFADEVRELTGGRGVDVVLNSLAGQALARSLDLLAPGGRFVEIGKRDVYDNSHLGLGSLKHNRSLFAVDLEHSLAEQPALVARLLDRISAGFAAGEFHALPVTEFPYSRAEDAFGHMARARHIGKVVLRPDERPPARVAVRAGGTVRPDATYLITGGLGALGLETARHLVDQGARHLVLAGRGGPGDRAESVVGELRERGADVLVRRADVSRAEDVAALLADLPAPLAGVVHAAGVLDDGVLLRLDADRLRTVAEPKAVAAWHLHRATADLDLDFFVLYSSAAALLGSAGQGNYAAANAFLDGLAQHRAALGLPALSVDWGAWSGAGLAARPDRGGALEARGVRGITPAHGVAALDRLLRSDLPQACVLPLDRVAAREAADRGLLPPLLARLVSDGAPATGRRPRGEVHDRMLAVEPGRRRHAILARHCQEEAARVLRLDPDLVDRSAPLNAMGFDSLLSLELRKRLETSLRVELPATVTWRYPTIDALVPFLAERMGVALEAPPADAAPEDDTDGLDDLSVRELEELLLATAEQIDEGRHA
ncbi:SDR family NAD(P)-dependent oxidoreductase [Actinosynnema sp. NPDC004786]